jgi:hypothetical protein
MLVFIYIYIIYAIVASVNGFCFTGLNGGSRIRISSTSYMTADSTLPSAAASTLESATSTVTSMASKLSNILEECRPLKTSLFGLSARTNRGEIASLQEKEKALDLITSLESMNPTPEPALSDLIYGTWELVYTNTNSFRSSPFFMAARAVCKDGEEADKFNKFCDLHRQALAFSSIGKVTQIISATSLVSDFATTAAVIPGLPITVKGTIQSSADIEIRTTTSMILSMDKVRIKSGTSNIPFMRGLLDEYTGLPIRAMGNTLQDLFEGKYTNPRPEIRTSFLDTHMRISRDQDNNVFVYNRI